MSASLLLVALLGGEASAAGPGPVSAAEGKLRVSLVADAREVAAGDGFRVGVRFQMAPGWHIYWKNPGESGLATEVLWSAGGGVRVDEGLRWPAPVRFEEGGIVGYGYTGEVLLWTSARAEQGGTVVADVDVLVCEKTCIPAQLQLQRQIAVGAATVADEIERARFDAAATAEPRAADGLTAEWRVEPSPVRPGDRFTATLTLRCGAAGACPEPRGRAETTAIFPERVATLSLRPRGWRVAADGALVVELDGQAGPDAAGADVQTVPLALVLEGAPPLALTLDLARAPALPGATPPAERAVGAATPAMRPAAPPAPVAAGPGLLALLGFAFLGGMILNLMPCVLPVLGIKVVGLTRIAGERRRLIALHGAAYAAGAVASMLALGGLVVALRAGGEQVGWGFQFQEPRFAVVVGMLLVAMAAAALGVWRVGDLGRAAQQASAGVDRRVGLGRSAGEGVLAVILATPCSAPFLGSAMGAALASPAPVVLAAFAAVGAGLAAPLVLLALAPGLRRLVPRPGAWMVWLERALALLLVAAAAWLAWLVWRVADAAGLTATLALWAATLLVVAVVGRAQRAARPLASRAAGGLGALALAVALTVSPGLTPAPVEARAVLQAGILWQPWDEAAVAAELAAGRTVFVDFTADWCITCKANERLVIESDAVREALRRGDVATFRADWTRRDDRIRRMLARHGRAGVPMYLVYSPARPEIPTVLPELLTTDRLLAALAAAAPVTLNEDRRPR